MPSQNYLNLVINGNWQQFFASYLSPITACVWITFFGVAFCAVVPRPVPLWFFSLSPVFGFGTLAILTSNIGIFMGVGNRAMFGFLVVISLGLIFRRREALKTGFKFWIIPWSAGMFIVVAMGLLPSISISNGQVLTHATSNHDSFFYAANEKWVATHPYSERPSIDVSASEFSDPPGAAPAYTVRELNIRSGDGLVSAFLNEGSNFEISKSWYASRTAWIWLAYIALLGASQLIGLTRRSAFLAALLSATSWQVIFQMYNQNAPAIIGLSLIPLAFVLGLQMRKIDGDRIWVTASSVILFNVYLTTYGELLPFAALAFLLAIIGRGKNIGQLFKEILLIGGLAVAITPYASLESFRYMLRVSAVVNSLGAPQYWARPLLQMGGDVFGLPQNLPIRSFYTTVFVLITILGIVLLSRKTKSVVPLLWTLFICVLWFRLGRSGALYSTDRLVQTMASTVIWMGITGLLLSLNTKLITRIVVLGSVFLFSVSNVVAPLSYLKVVGNLDLRTYSNELANLVNSAIQTSNGGKELMVASSNYVDRLWISNLCFQQKKTEYAFLTADYFRTYTRFDDNRADPVLLTNLKLTGSLGKQLGESGDYRIIGMEGATSALIVPTRQDQVEGNGDSISGSGPVEIRVLVWGESPVMRLQFEVVGVPLGSTVLTDGVVQQSKIEKSDFRLDVSPGSHTIQIVPNAQGDIGNWKVSLRDIGALR